MCHSDHLIWRCCSSSLQDRKSNPAWFIFRKPTHPEEETLTFPTQITRLECKYRIILHINLNIWNIRPLQPSWILARNRWLIPVELHTLVCRITSLWVKAEAARADDSCHISVAFFFFTVYTSGDERGSCGRDFTEKPEQSCQEEMKGIKIIYVSIPLQFTGDLYQVWGFLEGKQSLRGDQDSRGHSNLHME